MRPFTACCLRWVRFVRVFDCLWHFVVSFVAVSDFFRFTFRCRSNNDEMHVKVRVSSALSEIPILIFLHVLAWFWINASKCLCFFSFSFFRSNEKWNEWTRISSGSKLHSSFSFFSRINGNHWIMNVMIILIHMRHSSKRKKSSFYIRRSSKKKILIKIQWKLVATRDYWECK